MRIYVYFLITVFSICLIACSSDSESNDSNKLVVFENADVLVELIGIEDSRCPLDVTCVWEGDAVVNMSISSDGNVGEITLNSNPNVKDGQVEIERFGYNIKLLDVSPYPKTSMPIELEEYTITLDLEKL